MSKKRGGRFRCVLTEMADFRAVNPKEGAKLTVAEAARNNVCVGAKPIAVTNCLNFASPERPKIMWAFSETIDGIKEACEMFETPVISGNVSFYNETDGDGVLPTPTIGMVGLIEDSQKDHHAGFQKRRRHHRTFRHDKRRSFGQRICANDSRLYDKRTYRNRRSSAFLI